MDLNQITIPCVDYAVSVKFYQTLGLRQIVDSPPRYARFECPAGRTTLSLHAVDAVDRHAVVIYFEVEDVDARVQELKNAGVEFISDPADERWLWREARLRDPAGNELCIFHAGENRRHPPWRVK